MSCSVRAVGVVVALASAIKATLGVGVRKEPCAKEAVFSVFSTASAPFLFATVNAAVAQHLPAAL